YGPVDGLRSKVAQRQQFAGGEAAAAEPVIGCGKQMFGSGMQLSKEGKQPFEDRCRGLAMELLINNRLQQRFKGRVLALEPQRKRPGALHKPAQNRVRQSQLFAGLVKVIARSPSSVHHRVSKRK